MNINFKNKVVLITGASGKIGKKILNFFKNEKAIVYGIDLKKQKFNNSFQGDIADKIFVEKILTNIIKKHNRIDILINNAAKSIYTETNLHGTINLINAFIKLKKKRIKCFRKL